MRLVILVTCSALALVGCTADSLIDTAYPDRARFQFMNNDEDTLMFYACENGPTAQETQTRAQAAHRFLDGNITAAAETNATRMMDGIDAGRPAIGIAFEATRRLDAHMEVLGEQTEARFQCVMYKTQEV